MKRKILTALVVLSVALTLNSCKEAKSNNSGNDESRFSTSFSIVYMDIKQYKGHLYLFSQNQSGLSVSHYIDCPCKNTTNQ